MNDQIARLISVSIQQLLRDAHSLGLTWTLSIASIITSTQNQGTTIILDGDTVAISATNMSGNQLTGGDRVYCITVPQSGNYVIGRVEPSGGIEVYNAVGVTGSTASGTYVDMPGAPSVTITKAASTSLLVSLQTSCFNSVAGGIVEAAVNVNGSDYILCRFTLNTALEHHTFGGQRTITDVGPAGSFVITARWRQIGVGTLNHDTGDWVSLVVSDIP